ncbi:MAG: hypothetical protein QN194_15870 [Armatimonadota bacterium]|nr:hypothetical protein [Armatimonadota bacterium]
MARAAYFRLRRRHPLVARLYAWRPGPILESLDPALLRRLEEQLRDHPEWDGLDALAALHAMLRSNPADRAPEAVGAPPDPDRSDRPPDLPIAPAMIWVFDAAAALRMLPAVFHEATAGTALDPVVSLAEALHAFLERLSRHPDAWGQETGREGLGALLDLLLERMGPGAPSGPWDPAAEAFRRIGFREDVLPHLLSEDPYGREVAEIARRALRALREAPAAPAPWPRQIPELLRVLLERTRDRLRGKLPPVGPGSVDSEALRILVDAGILDPGSEEELWAAVREGRAVFRRRMEEPQPGGVG